MPGPLDWWNRIRRVVGPPGPPATRAAVPTDVDAARRAELAPVLNHVDLLESELRVMEEKRDDEIALIVAEAEQQANRLVADARERATAEQAGAGTRRRSEAADMDAELHSSAAAEAAAMQQRALEALPELVERAVAEARAFAMGPDPATGPEPS